jgi:YesN/AraC family two-component response regulator
MTRLMIVDDEVLSIEYICSLIDWEKVGYEIIAEMHSVKQAESVLESLPVDIVIFDVSMPGLTGVDLSSYIKKNHPNVAMLAISGYDNYDYVHEILLNGACDYILKHRLTKEVLLNALNEISAGKRGRSFDGGGVVLSARQQAVLLDILEKRDWDHLGGFITQIFRSSEENWRVIAQEMLQLVLVFLQKDGISVPAKATAEVLHALLTKEQTEVVSLFVKFVGDCYPLHEQLAYSHYVQAALDFINDNYMLNISLNDCAEVIGVNASYLSRIFHQETGEQFTRKLNKVRVQKARELIDAKLPLKQVAYDCGFQDYSYFNKVFRKENNCTPQQYAEHSK